jgi:hypothetical protein
MKPRFRLWTMLLAGSLLSSPNIQAGQIPLSRSPLERQTTENLDMKRYVAAGDRAYVVGVQDGSVVPSGIGWHITGQMGGVWAHPIKLLDHFQFYLNGQLLPPATKFVSGTGYVRQELPPAQGIEISETQFAPDGLPVVLVGVNLRSSNPGTTSITLAIEAQSELIAAYPWSGTTPSSESLHQQDQVTYDSETGALQFTQPGEPSWYALVSAAAQQDGGTSIESLGASGLGPAGSHNGAGGELAYRVTFSGQSGATIWFAVAGSNVGKPEAALALKLGLAFPQLLLHTKISQRQQVLSQAQIHVPDSEPMVQPRLIGQSLIWPICAESFKIWKCATLRKEPSTRLQSIQSQSHLFPASGQATPIIPGFSEPMVPTRPLVCRQLANGMRQGVI